MAYRYVTAEDDLQSMLNSARDFGTTLILRAGDTWSGSFTIPAGTKNLKIVSSEITQMAEGVRVTPSDASKMPKFSSPNEFAVPLNIEPETEGIKLIGIEWDSAYTGMVNTHFGMLRLGVYLDTEYGDGIEGVEPAKRILVDRCYIHGRSTGKTRDGILAYNCEDLVIKNCDIREFHGADEAHGIHVVYCPGPVLIHNNFIQAASINVFIGDSFLTADIPAGGLPAPQNVTITKNYCHKPMSWFEEDEDYDAVNAPWNYQVKNLIEIKGGSNILIEGNLCEGSWAGGAGQGDGITVTPRCDACDNITIRHNVLKNVMGGFQLANSDTFTGIPGTEGTMRNLLVENNLLYNDYVFPYPYGTYGVKMAGNRIYENNIKIRHITMIKPDAGTTFFILFYGDDTKPHLRHVDIRDCIATRGTYGVFGVGKPPGFVAVQTFCMNWYIDQNVLIGANPGYGYFDDNTKFTNWIFDNLAGVAFVDDTFDDIEDFALELASPYRNAATDGTDMGCDIDALIAAMAPGDVAAFSP